MIALASFLISATWKGSLLVAVALLATRLARGRVSSRWLHALLLIAVIRLMIPVAPEARFSVFNFARPSDALPLEPALLVAPAPAGAFVGHLPSRVTIATPSTDPWSLALLSLWAAGVVFAVLRAVRRTRALRRMLRDRQPVTAPDVLALVDACRMEVGVRRYVDVHETAAIATPSLHGWLRPALLLPVGFVDTFSRQQLRFVLLHELAHHRRSDVLVHWLTTIAQALHWFNPLVHLAAARLHEERELACDALALERLRSDERIAYGGTVLEVLDRLRQPSAVPGLVGMTTTHQQLKRRIKMIAGFRPQSRHSLLFAGALTLFALMTLTDAVAGERVMFRKSLQSLSPAAEATMKQLETPMHLQLTNASLEEVARAVTQQTGVAVVFADGVLAGDVREATLTVTADNVPAHMVLIESLTALELAVNFDEHGAQVQQLPEGAAPMRMRVEAGELPRIADGNVEEHVVVVHGDSEAPPLPVDTYGAQPRVRTFVHVQPDTAEDGVVRRNVKFRGGPEGQAEGTFSLEVRRNATSTSR
jgi:beta-lactamase regulating signal transducer with metallopeptidase domain